MNKLTVAYLKQLADFITHFNPPSKIKIPPECGEIVGPYYSFLYLLAKAAQPSLIVELGTGREARSAVHFALGAPNAKVIGIDLEIPTFVPYPNIEWWQGNTRAMEDKIAALNMPIDLLFIDSEHTTRQALSEYVLYSPLVREGGIILFDDINMGGMEGLWSCIPEPKFTHDGLHPPQGFGIAIRG